MAKKNKKINTDDNSNGNSLDVIRQAVLKKFGGVLNMMGEADMSIKTLSSGSIGLDIALGRGGFALGRIYEIFGPTQGGKTTLAISTIVEAQKKNKVCAFFDAERSCDEELFVNMGIDVNKLYLVQAYTGEEYLNIMEMMIASGEIDLCVLDSVSALVPMAEQKGQIGDSHVGIHARMMSTFLRKITPIAGKTNTTILLINQLRNTIGGYGGKTTTGGEAIKFFSTGRVNIYPQMGGKIEIDGNRVGHMVGMETVKNKLSHPYQTADVPLIYGYGYDKHWEVLLLAASLGIIDIRGSWVKYNDITVGQGVEKVKDLFKTEDSKELYEEIRAKVIENTGLLKYYEQNSD